MLLYVNGDEITSGACCVNDFVYSEDDIRHITSGKKAHPENLMHSFGYYLSRLYQLGFKCEATIKQSNQQIIDEVHNFIDVSLPKLKSNYTIICVGLLPGVDVDALNNLAEKIDNQNIEKVFFNISKPMPIRANLNFSNVIDLKDSDECFIQWCKNKNYELKNQKYPDVHAHNAWAKYIFNKMNQSG